MKKKAIKIAASTAVAASAFVAAAPAHQADAAVNVNQLVTDAQNAGTVLKWAISLEGTADFVTQPWTQYNAAKKALDAVEKAAKGLSTSEKLSVDAKLVDAKLQVKRAAAYIDAITSSVKIKELTAGLDAAIKSDDIEKVETAYHKATGEYRKQSALLDRVYGQSTRDGIRNEVKPAIEKSVASVKNEVTVNMLLKAAAANGKAGKIVEAGQNLADAEAILNANTNLKWATALNKSFNDVKAAIPALPNNIAIDTAAFQGEAGNIYAVTANIKTKSGAAYNGRVKISFDEKGKKAGETKADDSLDTYAITKVNTTTLPANTIDYTADVVNGQLVIAVTSPTSIAGGKIKFETLAADDSVIDTQYSGTLNFYDKVTTDNQSLDAKTVKYVDAANNYFVTTDLQKYTLKATGNVFQDTNNAVITLDAFKTKLTAGDLLKGTYNYTGGSVIQLWVHKVEEAEFSLDQDYVGDTKAYRVEGNTVTLSGTGEAGKLVSIYKGITGTDYALTTVKVGSNGLWSTNVSVTAADTVFTAYQAKSVNEKPKTYAEADATDETESITVTPGKFTVKQPTITVAPDSSLTEGLPVVFTADLAADKDKTVKVASNASITLVDASLLSATYVNGVGGTVIEKDDAGFKVTFGTPTKLTQPGKNLTGSLTVTSVTGVKNAYGFELAKVSK